METENPVITPPAVHETQPMKDVVGGPIEGEVLPVGATIPGESPTGEKQLSSEERKKLGRAVVELYLVAIGVFDKKTAEDARDNKNWYNDSVDVASEIMIEDFGIYDLKEVRWVRAGILGVPPAIKAYKAGEKRKEDENAEKRKREEDLKGDGAGDAGTMGVDPGRKVRRRKQKGGEAL